jgi:hypothetical protein
MPVGELIAHVVASAGQLAHEAAKAASKIGKPSDDKKE